MKTLRFVIVVSVFNQDALKWFILFFKVKTLLLLSMTFNLQVRMILNSKKETDSRLSGSEYYQSIFNKHGTTNTWKIQAWNSQILLFLKV